MKKRYFMGIDVAKATFDFCLLSRSGACLWRGQFSNDARAIERFVHQLRAHGWKLEQIHFALEATGVYGQKLIAALHQAGLAVSVLNPAQVKYFALSLLRRTKNDTVDAEIIARFCRERKPLATQPLRPIETNSNSWCGSAKAEWWNRRANAIGPKRILIKLSYPNSSVANGTNA
jgi:transposase